MKPSFFKKILHDFQNRWLHLKFLDTKVVLAKKKNTVEGYTVVLVKKKNIVEEYTSLFVLLLSLRSSPFLRQFSILPATIHRGYLRRVLFQLFYSKSLCWRRRRIQSRYIPPYSFFIRV